MTSSNTSSAPCSVASSRSSSRKPHSGGTRPMLAGYGSQHDGGELVLAERGPHRRRVVPRHDDRLGGRGRRHAGRRREALRGHPRARLGEQPVDVAVVGAGELQHHLAAGRGAREPQRAHRRLGARGGHAQHVHGRHPRAHQLGQLDLAGGRRAEARAARGRVGDRVDHRGVRVAVDQRAPRADVVDVRVAVDVHDLGALGALDEDRVAADRPHRAHGRVHAARQDVLRALVQLRRPDVRDRGGQARSSSQRLKSPVK